MTIISPSHTDDENAQGGTSRRCAPQLHDDHTLQRQQLQSLLDQSWRSTRPLYISTMGYTGPQLPGDTPNIPHGWMGGQVGLLDALSMVLLVDGVGVLQAPLGAPAPPPATALRSAAKGVVGGGGTPGVRGVDNPTQRLLEVREFLQQHGALQLRGVGKVCVWGGVYACGHTCEGTIIVCIRTHGAVQISCKHTHHAYT